MQPDTITTLDYDFRNTRIGTLLVAASRRGVCFVRFGDRRAELEAALCAEFPFARPRRHERTLVSWCDAIAAYVEGVADRLEIPIDVRGSRFQRRVWRELASIPRGETRSYSDIASAVGSPKGARAVARACASNPTPVVVPCHRVIERNGGLGGYAFGQCRKLQLLANEGARIEGIGPVAGGQPPSFGRESTRTASPTATAPSAMTRR